MSKNDSNPKNYIIRGPKLKIGQLNHKESEAFNLNQQSSEIDTRVIYTLGLTTIFNLKKYTPQTYQNNNIFKANANTTRANTSFTGLANQSPSLECPSWPLPLAVAWS